MKFLNYSNLLYSGVQRQLWENFKPDIFPMFHTNTGNNKNSQDLCNCLISLIDNSDFDVSLMSAELLFDIFNIEYNILSRAKEVYVYSPEESVYGHEREILAAMTDTVQLITKLTQRQHIMDDDKENIILKLDNFSKLCILDESETEPNVTMQAIAYSCGEACKLLDLFVFNNILQVYLMLYLNMYLDKD